MHLSFAGKLVFVSAAPLPKKSNCFSSLMQTVIYPRILLSLSYPRRQLPEQRQNNWFYYWKIHNQDKTTCE